MSTVAPIGNRENVAEAISSITPENESWLRLLMENPTLDDALLDGIHLFLDRAASARFLNTLKLQKIGEWLGNAAPARLQIRISEAAKSSQHPAFSAFREGYNRSGGFQRAYPAAKI